MASRWNQQEQGSKRRKFNQPAKKTQPAAQNPNKNTKSTDTRKNSGKTVAAKPAAKAAPKQNKPKTVYYRSKDDAKPVYKNPAKTTRKPQNTTVQKAKKSVTYYTNKDKTPQEQAASRLAKQKGTAQVLTGKRTPLPPKRATRMGQTLNPMEQLKTDAKLGRENWISRATVPSKKLTAEQQRKKNQQTAKQSGFNARARRQTLSSYDQKLPRGKQFQIQQAKQRYDEAKAKGDRAGMEKAHREAENLRYTAGYSGGATGNERIAPKLSQDNYNRLNASGRLAMTQAQMTRDRATTEDEIARADRRIEEILNAPGYQNNRLSAAETGKGWSYGPDGRRMWAGTKEQNRADAAQGAAGFRAVGEGIAGGLLYAGQTASRATRDKFERENIDKWIADEANYNQAKSDLEFIRSYKKQFGVVPEGYNEMQAQIAYNNAVQAMAQLQRIRGDVDSLYFDPTVAERLGLPTTRDETLGERLLRQAAEDQAKATEGMNGVERFVTNALISTGQSVPGMALGLIPGVGPALGLGVLGAQAGGSRAYDLRQQGVTAEDAYRAGFISGGIEALTEKLPLKNFAQIIKNKGGKSALRNVLEQAGLEGSEEAVSYVGNYIADVAQQNPDAHFSWLELLENAGMGAISGAAFGVAGGILSPGHAVSPAGAQSEEIQEHARGAAAQVEAVQDAETQIRTAAAQRLREDAQAYNEMVKAGVWSDAEKEMVKASLDQRYAEIAGQNAGQTSPVANQAPLTQVFEDGMQRNRGRAERAPAASVPTPLAANETPASVNPVEQAERMTAEALRATDAEMARRDAVAQLQAETPPITYERSGLPPTSFLGAAIDARREARARAEAEAQVRRDQEIARQNRAAAEAAPNAVPTATQVSPNVETRQQVQQPVSRLEGLASTFGESGAASLRTIGGKMVTGQGALVRDFTDVYNQVLGGRSESQVSRPAGMSDANYFAAVTAAKNDRQTGWDLDILKASKAAGRNVNAGVDWRDQYVRQMDRKTARTVDGLAKALGVKVVFAEKGSILTAGGTAANAEITGNVVRIEKGNPNPVRMLIGHELTHRMQDVSPESYRAFRDYAMSVPGSMDALERTVSLYQRAGAFRAQDNVRQMAMDEVTADFAGDLLENSEQLQEFIRRNYENRTMLEVIRDFFRDLAAKLTGRQKAQADEAVRLLEEAIKGASARVKETGKAEKGNKNTAREGGVKKLFSLSAPVEETETLVALHNLDAEKIDRSLRLGAFPAPSIAVVKAKEGHSKFGPISIVFPRSTIDPEASRKNRVYGSDAWTPTHSNARVEYPVNYDALLRIEKQLEELSGQVAGGTFRGNSLLRRRGLDDDSSMDRKELAERLSGDDEVRAAYLAAQGRTLEPVMREKEFDAMGNDFLQTILDTVGEQEIAGMTATLMEGGRLTEADKGTLREIWRQNWINSLPKRIREKRSPEFIEEKSHDRAAELSDFKMEQFVRHTWDYYENHGVKGDEIDRIATSDKLRAAVNDADVTAWMEDQLDGLLGEPGVYNGKEPYTASGNKRSFATLHYPYTAEGIVRAMYESTSGSRGQNALGVNANTLISVATPEYGSVDEIHADEDRLRQLPEEEYKALLAPIDAGITSFIQGVKKTNKAFAASDYEEGEIIASILMDNAGKKTAKAIQSGFRKEGYTLSPELAKSALEIFKQARAVPTGYFEAKPERVVGFDEVLAAVVPSDMDAGLRSRMEEAGMRLIDYERDNEQSRMDAVNSVEGARFSITPQADADYMAAVESGDMETAQRMVDDAAEKAGYGRFGDFFADKSLDLKTPSPTARQKQMFEAGKKYGDSDSGFNQFYDEDPDLAEYYVYNSNLQRWYYAGARDEMPEYRLAIRYGDIPEGGRSRNWATGELERGVSAVDFLTDKTQGKQTIYDAIYGIQDATKNIIGGWDFGIFGSDGEPLLVGAKNVVPFTEVSKFKLADPVTYDDNGDVIPLSERFNAETGDIRYSIGTEGYDRARLMRENQELKEKLEYWRGQVKKSDRTKADPKEVRKLAKSLRADYSTDMDAGEITQRLQAIYDGIGKDWSYDRAYEEAGKLARDMIEQAEETDEGSYYQQYKDLRKYLKETTISYIEGDLADTGDESRDFLRKNFGRMKLVKWTGDPKDPNRPLSADQIWGDLAERYPEYFNETAGETGDAYGRGNASNTNGSILRYISDLLDSLSETRFHSVYVDYQGYDSSDEAAGYLATEIMDMFWDVPAVKKTFADRMQNRLDRQIEKTNQAKEQGRERVQAEREKGNARVRAERERGAQRVQTVREQRDRAIARLRADHKEKYEKALQRARDQREQALKKQSERYLTAKKKRSRQQKERELRAKIVRHCGRLSAKLKSGTDKQHVPEVMQRIVATALDSINLGSGFTLVYDENGKAKRVKDGSGEITKRTEAFEELRKFYQQIITADPDEDLAGEMPEIISKIVVSDELPKMIDGIIGLRDTPIANLGKADLDKIWETVKAIETTISTYDKALGQARFETISEPAFAIQDYAAPKKDRRNYAGAMKHVDRLLNVGMLKPIYFLYRLGDGGKMVWKMIEDAQGTNIRYLDEIRAYQEEHFKPGTAKRLEKEKHTFNFDGQKIELTTAQLINLYNLRKREQAEGHILEGGFRPDQIVKGIRDVTPAAPWHFTAEQIGEMLDVVAGDAELVRIADAMMDGIKPQAVHGNAASMEVYGIKKYRERNYWPIESDENQTQTDIKNEAVSKTVAGSGFAKATQKGANNAVILRSAFDVYNDHVVGMAKYAAWLGPLENMRRILNFRYKDETGHFGSGVKEMLTKIIGKDGPGYYKKLMDDLNAGIKATSDNPFQQFIGSYKATAIAGNIRVVAQQLTSIPRAMEEIDPQDFLLGMAQARPGQWENEIKKYAPIAIWKDWGYFTADTGRQMRNIFWGDDNFIQTANNLIMNNRVFSPGTMDAIGWTAIWNALKSETKRTRKDLNPDSEEFMYAVRDRFNEVINKTQVVDGIPQRSQLMRSENDVTKMATSFMGEPTTTYNMLTFAIHEARTSTGAERGKAMRHLARTTVALATSIALNAAAQSLVDAMRDDDKDEEYWEKFFQALYGWEGDTRKDRIKSAILNGNLGAGMNPLTYIPFIKDVVSKRQGYKVTRMDMDIISRVMDSYDAVVKAMNGEGKKTRKNAWINFIAECSRFLGVPVANIKRDILSGVSTVFQVTGNYRYQYELEKFLYNIEGTGNFSEFAKLAYLAKRDGDTEAYEAIRADLIANGPKSEKDVDKKISELEKKAVTDTEEFQTALTQKADAYQTMLEASDAYQSLPAEKQETVGKALDEYAEYQALNGQFSMSEKDQATVDAIQGAEAAEINAVDYEILIATAGDIHNATNKSGDKIDKSASVLKREAIEKSGIVLSDAGRDYMYDALNVSAEVRNMTPAEFQKRLADVRKKEQETSQ